MSTPPITTADPNLIRDVELFHEKFGLEYYGPPRELCTDLQRFRMKFIQEEHGEFVRAMLDEIYPNYYAELSIGEWQKKAREQQLDAICDLIYVLIGYAHLRGWDLREAWSRVQKANMTKVRAGQYNSQARSPWDVVKPKNFFPPDHSDLV